MVLLKAITVGVLVFGAVVAVGWFWVLTLEQREQMWREWGSR